MASHEGIQGTSRPAHHTALLDENGFSNDQLQSLTYYQCHLYAKCPRAVYLPTPVYYAHLVAFRAAELATFEFFNGTLDQDSASGANGRERTERELEDEEDRILETFIRATDVKELFASSMYVFPQNAVHESVVSEPQEELHNCLTSSYT